MTSPISGVGAIPYIPPTTGVQAAAPTGGTSFASAVGNGLDALQKAQGTADTLAVQAATGTLTDISQYTVAATQAQVMTEFAAALRSKAVESFNQIMGMQA
jgi:flagellar hook-basal body complex protein FliE